MDLRAAIVDVLPEIVLVLDRAGTITFAAGAVGGNAKLRAEDLQGRRVAELIHPEDLGDAARGFASMPRAGVESPSGPVRFRYIDRDGAVRDAEAWAIDRSDDPTIGGTVVLVRDVVGERAIEDAFESLVEGGGFGIVMENVLRAVEEAPITAPGWVLRAGERVEVAAWSRAARALGDLAAQVGDWVREADAERQVVDADLSTVSPPLRQAMQRLGLRSLLAMPVRTAHAPRPGLWLVAGNRFGGADVVTESPMLKRYASVLAIAHERVRLQDELRFAATHDGLTGLANRAEFLAQVRATTGGEWALLFLDLDGFKPVNDRLGHLAGDALLVEVATRLRAVVAADDLVARLGGDEFAILLRESTPGRGVTLAEAAVAAIGRPIGVEGEEVVVGVSVGVAVGPATELPSLLDRADGAMYEAKAEGGGRGGWSVAALGDRRIADRRRRRPPRAD
jgi:diguanylate cyclase (GGDEF)-like protein